MDPVVIFNQKIEDKFLDKSKKFALNIFKTLSLFKGIEMINKFFNEYKDQCVDIGVITWKKNNIYFHNGELYKNPSDLEYPVLIDGVSKISEIHSVYIISTIDSNKGFYPVVGRISETDKLNKILYKRNTIIDLTMNNCLTEYNFYLDESEHLTSIFYAKWVRL